MNYCISTKSFSRIW